jgi:hypothetical protein
MQLGEKQRILSVSKINCKPQMLLGDVGIKKTINLAEALKNSQNSQKIHGNPRIPHQ